MSYKGTLDTMTIAIVQYESHSQEYTKSGSFFFDSNITKAEQLQNQLDSFSC